jgi:hypothetical protein
MNRRTSGAWAIAAAVVFGSSGAASAASADATGCARVQKAFENVVTTPGHSYTTETSSQRGNKQTESIYLDGKVYVLSNERWILSPLTSREMLDELRKSGKHATLACRAAGEETVEDRTAIVYTTTSQTGDSRTESRLWIDKVSGLLLRQEEDLTGGGQTVHRSIRYEYGNVKAPKLAD